jgi:hypothetical protein
MGFNRLLFSLFFDVPAAERTMSTEGWGWSIEGMERFIHLHFQTLLILLLLIIAINQMFQFIKQSIWLFVTLGVVVAVGWMILMELQQQDSWRK